MIINKITINNYGIYYSENVYDFRVNTDGKNIILINGKNGSGKTTLLESIKLSLYGSLFYGLKHPNKKYYEAIEKKFNTKALNEGIKEAFIELDFLWNENNSIDNYKIKRIWNLKSIEGSLGISENVEIVKNDKILSSQEVENTENYFRTVFPQKIFDFFFFDGEDVKNLISNEYLENELKEAVYTLFGMDIFKNLGSNLESYIKNRSKSSDLTLEEKKLIHEMDSKEKILRNIDDFKKKITQLSIEEEDNQNELDSLRRKFKNYGGELYDKRGEIEKKISDLENERSRSTDQLKSFLGNEIPLILNNKLLHSAIRQLEREDSVKEFNALSNKINDGTIENILLTTFKEKQIQKEEIETFKRNLINSFNQENTKLLHNLSYDETQRIKNALKGQEEREINRTLIERRNNLEIAESNKLKLNELKNNTIIEEILNEIEDISKKRESIRNEKDKINEVIGIEEDKLIVAEKNILELKNKVILSKKNNNKFNVVNKVQNILDKFVSIKNAEKIKEVKTTFLETFNSLHRKEGFIRDVEINPETLEVKLYHKYGLLDNYLLSAGEKQIYILSLLFAFLKVSGKELPLVFDTLLGRLDEDHRSNIIKSYLPKASKQVIILSTDSEVRGSNYELVKPFIAKEYTIDYNIENQTLRIQKHEGVQ